MKLYHNKIGFTLIELIIATSLFTVFILASVASYQSIATLNIRSEVTRQTVEDTRQMVTRMEQMIRGLYLDRKYYTGSNTGLNVKLVLRSLDADRGTLGQIRYIFRRQIDENNRGYITLEKMIFSNGFWVMDNTWQSGGERFSPTNIDIKSLKFFLGGDLQGRSNVTILLSLRRQIFNKVIKGGFTTVIPNKYFNLNIQTTSLAHNF